jgi:hypothetical protein
MKKMIVLPPIAATMHEACVFARVKQSKEQILFYASGRKSESFPGGRSKIPGDLLKCALTAQSMPARPGVAKAEAAEGESKERPARRTPAAQPALRYNA